MKPRVYVGCAGWSIPGMHREHFPVAGSHLQRYAERFSAVEINTSFYRPHRPDTYARWAASVPEGFRFAVKVPKQFTHVSRLADVAVLKRFLAEASVLGEKLGPLLLQLPPSLAFRPETIRVLLEAVRDCFTGSLVCEPRHASWFMPEVEQLLADLQVARVAADPAPMELGSQPGGWGGLVYYRLHGSPRTYYSSYQGERLDALARVLTDAARVAPVWCIFDNTAEGAATVNALALQERVQVDEQDGGRAVR